VALVLAIILLLVYLSHYRSSVKSESAATPVLRAKVFIPAGTTAEALAKKSLFEVAAIPKDQLKDGAVTDAAAIHGQVALNDIYPGQQLLVTDFGATATSSALSGSSELLGAGAATGTWRALAINLDETHGIIPQVQTGDHVDAYVQMGGTLGLLKPNVLILQAPNQTAEGTTAATSGTYILRVGGQDVPKFAYAAQNGTIWFALRPQEHAKTVITKPVSNSSYFGGR
jgi:Flp pilus assembly protein CpaB